MSESNQVGEMASAQGDIEAAYQSRVSEFAELDYLALYGKQTAQAGTKPNPALLAEAVDQSALDVSPVIAKTDEPQELKKQEPSLVQSDWPTDMLDLLPVKSSLMPMKEHRLHEPSPAGSKEPGSFVLGTVTVKSATEIAVAISSDEAGWESGKKDFYPLLNWLEAHDSAEDVAVFRGLLQDGATPDFILFKFVHKKNKLPFIYGGNVIDIKQLYLCLKQVVTGKATMMQRSLVSMLGNGQLWALHNEYVLLSGMEENFMQRLLVFLKGKAPSEQWVYLSALQKPEDYIWPKGGFGEEKETLLPLMISLGTLPISEAYMVEVKECCEVPPILEGLLADAATYSIGALQLHDLHGKTLRTRHESESKGEPSPEAEPVSTELAGTLFLERTPETFVRIEDALNLTEKMAAEISGSNRPEAIALLSSIAGYFRQLRDRRAEEKEMQFLLEVSAMKKRIARHEKYALLFRSLATAGAGMAGGVAALFLGAAMPLLFVTVFFFAITLCFALHQIRTQLWSRRSDPGSNFDLVGSLMTLTSAWVAWGVIGRFFTAYPVPLALGSAGAAFACLFDVIYTPLQSRLREDLLTLFMNRYSMKEERLI